MGYKLLGYVVWNGAKIFLRRRYGHLVPPRGALIGGLAGVAALAVVMGARKASS
ncbi:MAG TPA: hypothetical protein VFT42_09590 [Solirubrobacteraceae bacterium]|nr:hypothetical protein [Solirubrobacteraceae bacterium]